eukprot:77506-Pelagomonas_calceolata.AAC.2
MNIVLQNRNEQCLCTRYPARTGNNFEKRKLSVSFWAKFPIIMVSRTCSVRCRVSDEGKEQTNLLRAAPGAPSNIDQSCKATKPPVSVDKILSQPL